MGKFILLATSDPTQGREDEYNDWYEAVHIQDLLAVPGIKTARRFAASPSSVMPPPSRYLAIYEIEADDIGQVMAELGRRATAGEIRQSDTLDRSSTKLWLWEELRSGNG